jgi:protein-tyrosine phosphatase
MDWFEELTGFAEGDGRAVREHLQLDGEQLVSRVSGRRFGVGRLSTPTLGELRAAGRQVLPALAGSATLQVVSADVRQLLGDARGASAVFQVASQFNLLEMVSPSVTPDMGVTRYATDMTQGPACAMAAGGATLYRHYFVPFGSGRDATAGQTAERQIDTAAGLRDALAATVGLAPEALWTVRNGYALPTAEGLDAVDRRLALASPAEWDGWRERLRVGLHEDVEITRGRETGHRVTQVFTSAMPVAYTKLPLRHWSRLARLVLQASYEATLWAGVLNASRTGCPTVYLTLLGGGAFGNPREWILEALADALRRVATAALDVRLVCYGEVPDDLVHWAGAWNAGQPARAAQAGVRTSLTDPLRIDELGLDGAPGLIGLTLCPGKQARSALGLTWQRDLSADLEVVRAWGAQAVVTLLEPQELAALGVQDLGAMVQGYGMQWLHLPIRDGCAPDGRFEARWTTAAPQLSGVLRGGGRVLVHCRGGLGRAGTVAARLLIERGLAPSLAIARVRAARPGAIETLDQEAHLRARPVGTG